jgi:hypothetical protein
LWSPEAHDRLIDAAFPDLDPKLRDAIKEGSRFLDLSTQLGDPSLHAMRDAGETPEAARTRACAFIGDRIKKYRGTKDVPVEWIRRGAYEMLGAALHPVMDSTSPAHQGWQVWELHVADLWTPDAPIHFHGNNAKTQEDVNHLTPALIALTVKRIRAALDSTSCSCLDLGP